MNTCNTHSILYGTNIIMSGNVCLMLSLVYMLYCGRIYIGSTLNEFNLIISFRTGIINSGAGKIGNIKGFIFES